MRFLSNFGCKIIFMRSVNFVINRIPSHCLKEALVTWPLSASSLLPVKSSLHSRLFDFGTVLGIQCQLISQCGGKLNLINARQETAIKVEKFAIKDLVKGKARSSKRSQMSQLFIDSNVIPKKNYDTKDCFRLL